MIIFRDVFSYKTLAINGFCITSTLKNHIELTITSLTDIYKRLSVNYVVILCILKKKKKIFVLFLYKQLKIYFTFMGGWEIDK